MQSRCKNKEVVFSKQSCLIYMQHQFDVMKAKAVLRYYFPA